ncbi:MAG: alpha-glucosidase/alpha-galactosidase, partial [Eubacteriales bacterium]
INRNVNAGKAVIKTYLGVEKRKEALKDANFVVNAIQVGGYDPCTITDFEVPKKYGLEQTIADSLGIGGIMRSLRTIPIMQAFADDMEEVCPDAWLLNYTNPMGILTGYMQRYTSVKTIGLCHSVQVCTKDLLEGLGMEDKLEGRVEKIAGINHMGWLLELRDKDGNDLYPEIKKRALEKNAGEKHKDMVRYEYIKHFGHYCTESSEHNAEYNPFFIKSKYPELIDKYNIPLDEYPRRCIKQIAEWEEEKNNILANGEIKHERSKEYASYIIEAIASNTPYMIGGNVINCGNIENLPNDACVEVPCMVDGNGITPIKVGRLPEQLAAMNMTNVNVQLLTIKAAVTKKKEHIYQAAMMDPHTAAELSIDDIVKMCDELIERHGEYMNMYLS